MKNKLFLVIFCILSIGLNAATVKGKVFDHKDYESLTGIKISFINTTTFSCYNSYSDFDGNYETNIPSGNYIIIVYGISYQLVQTYATISTDIISNFKLNK